MVVAGRPCALVCYPRMLPHVMYPCIFTASCNLIDLLPAGSLLFVQDALENDMFCADKACAGFVAALVKQSMFY